MLKIKDSYGAVIADPPVSQFAKEDLTLPPAGNARRDAFVPQPAAELFQPAVRALPVQVAKPLLQRNVVTQSGQLAVKQRLLTALGQAFGQTCGAARRYRFQPPLARIVRDRFQMLEAP